MTALRHLFSSSRIVKWACESFHENNTDNIINDTDKIINKFEQILLITKH